MRNTTPQDRLIDEPPEDIEMEFSEHFVELAQRLKNILIVLGLSSLILGLLPEPWTRGLFTEYSPPMAVTMTKWLQAYHLPPDIRLYTTGFTQVISAYILVALGMGLIVSWPIIIREVYLFIRPALYKHEVEMIRTYVGLFLILFWGGCALSFFIIMPLTFVILVGIIQASEIQPIFTIDSFIGFLFFGVVGIGLAFTFPIFSTMLVYTGVYDSRDLKARWREAITGLFIITAFLTPDPTPFTTTIIFIPMAGLYYLAIRMAEHAEGGPEALKSRESLIKAALLVATDQLSQTEEQKS
ncbi:MAG: twin-arginine translocase subunit TatC [Candidatus Heimdallarchaeota archaeon]